MMSEELKAVLLKPKEEQTEDDKKLMKDAVDAFQKETLEMAVKHGLAHQAVIKVTERGIIPAFEVVAYEPPQTAV